MRFLDNFIIKMCYQNCTHTKTTKSHSNWAPEEKNEILRNPKKVWSHPKSSDDDDANERKDDREMMRCAPLFLIAWLINHWLHCSLTLTTLFKMGWTGWWWLSWLFIHLMIILYGLAICCQGYRPAIGGICLEMEAFALKFFVPSAPLAPLAVVNWWLKNASIPLHWWQLQREELPPPNMTLCTVDSIILQATLSTLVF